MLRSDALSSRVTLLKQVCDNFIASRAPDIDERQQFEVITQALMSRLDEKIVLPLAKELIFRPHVPQTLLDYWMSRSRELTLSILRYAPRICEQSLLLHARLGDSIEAQAIAQRPSLPTEVLRSLLDRAQQDCFETLATNHTLIFPPKIAAAFVGKAQNSPCLALLLCRNPNMKSQWLAPLYLYASPPRRLSIIQEIRRLALGKIPDSQLSVSNREDLDRIEHLASQKRYNVMALQIARSLHLLPTAIKILLNDSSGDALALILRALGMEWEQAARIFLSVPKFASHSIQKVADLTLIVKKTEIVVAQQLIFTMIGQSHPKTTPDNVRSSYEPKSVQRDHRPQNQPMRLRGRDTARERLGLQIGNSC